MSELIEKHAYTKKYVLLWLLNVLYMFCVTSDVAKATDRITAWIPPEEAALSSQLDLV